MTRTIHAVPDVIVGRGLYKVFDLGGQTVRALDGVDVRVRQGQFVAVMGPSGSGKSTLLYVLGGLDRPSAGEIAVGGARLDTMTGEQLARLRRDKIGFVFQAFHLVPTMTALENVALPGVFANMAREAREARALRLLDALGMRERIGHKPSQLSGGQQQRVAIARALFNDPPIIMTDEPTGALDSKTGQVVMKLLRWLCTRQGKTVIVVTHDSGVASYADRLIQIKDGRITGDYRAGTRTREDVA